MDAKTPTPWLTKAAEELNQHENRKDGTHVAGCLSSGLAILRDLLHRRLYEDVERFVGKDSMLLPVSAMKAQRQLLDEIEGYQIAESVEAARKHRYVSQPDDWYLPWLARLRGGEKGRDARFAEQARTYLAPSADDRRLAFVRAIDRIFPESTRAPLIVFRLLPLAIHLATACAFNDRASTSDLRRQQVSLLPAIADCHECHGRLLECVEQCRTCGNPLWKYEWLTAAD